MTLEQKCSQVIRAIFTDPQWSTVSEPHLARLPDNCRLTRIGQYRVYTEMAAPTITSVMLRQPIQRWARFEDRTTGRVVYEVVINHNGWSVIVRYGE